MPKKAPYKLPPLEISKKDIGNNIARIRKSKGLTQIDLAEEIGITQTLVSDYETGRSVLSSEMLIRFALALKINTDILLGLNSEHLTPESTSLKIMRRVKEIEGLSAADQKKVLQSLDMILQGVKG